MSAPVELTAGWQPPVFSKTPEEKAALRQLLSMHVLFSELPSTDIEVPPLTLVTLPLPLTLTLPLILTLPLTVAPPPPSPLPTPEQVLLDAFQGLRFLPGARIITQGDIGKSFYFLQSGGCAISVQGQGVVSRAGPGDCFGELALLYDSPRAATVEAVSRCNCWSLELWTFKRIVKGNAMQRNARHHAFLDRVPVLASLGRYEQCRLLEAIRTQHVSEGEEIIREGSYGSAFYIIEEGEVRCSQQGSSLEICRRLVASDFFGERALLSTERRAATVTATRDSTLLVLDRETFLRLLGPLEECIRLEAARQGRHELSDHSSGEGDGDGEGGGDGDGEGGGDGEGAGDEPRSG